jgi:transcriptional regulator NrdR family protein
MTARAHPQRQQRAAPSMNCPLCSAENSTQVVQSSPFPAYIRRRRKCLNCKGRFSTREILTDAIETKLLKEDRRAANKSFRVLAEQHGILYEQNCTVISLVRRLLRNLGYDDSILGELKQLPRGRRA